MRKNLAILMLLQGLVTPCWPGIPEVELELMTTGLSRPLFVTHCGDGSGRLFIVEQSGRIRIFKDGSLLPTPFLDISTGFNLVSSGEQGLLGLAFHPDYPTNGRFFINYTREIGGQKATVIEEHSVSGNPDIANPGGSIVLTFDQPAANHNAGWMGFGPSDGFLYISTGDGGGQNDPNQNGQNLATLLGKILRIDVDSGSPYAVPFSNPFSGVEGVREEIWAYGFRNPWRCSFDSVSGRLFCGDVGQSTWEEVDIVESGVNYGWDIVEGPACHEPAENCDMTGLEPPITFYGRSDGRSVTGGYLYRGSAAPSLVGDYVFGDYVTRRVWALSEGPGGWDRRELLVANFNPSSFGRDEAGEIYIADHGVGRILKIVGVAGNEQPDIRVIKEGPTEALQGEQVVFSIAIENLGPGDSTAVTLTDTLPAGLDFVSALPSQGNCVHQSGQVTCTLGALTSGEVAGVTVTTLAQQAGEWTNSAAAVSENGDDNPANNQDDAIVSVASVADLSVTKTVEPNSVGLDGEAVYTLTITNAGPGDATGVIVSDQILPPLSILGASAACTVSGGSLVTCSIPELGEGITLDFQITVRAEETGFVNNTATVQANESDPDASNNASETGLNVVATPDLVIVKEDLGPFVVGSPGGYRILVRNQGKTPTSGPISVVDELPTPLSLFSVDAAGWACSEEANTLECMLDASVAPDEVRELYLNVLVGPSAVPEVFNQVTVMNESDANPSNNSADILTPAFEVGVLPRRFAQLALGDLFEVLLLVSNKTPVGWHGRGVLGKGNHLDWDTAWAVNGDDHTGSSFFDVNLEPFATQKFHLTGDTSVQEGFLDVIGTQGSVNSDIALAFFYQLRNASSLQESTATFDTAPSKIFVFPVEKDPTADTGLAYVALDSGASFPISAFLFDQNGNEIASADWMYQGHDALFFTQVFQLEEEDFVGSVRLESEGSLFVSVVRVDEAGEGFQLTNTPPETIR